MRLSILLLLLIFFSSCARVYRPVNPNQMTYDTNVINEYGLELDYYYDQLALRGNKKLAKKEKRKDIRLVVVKITNHNDYSLNLRNDLVFVVGQQPIKLMAQQYLYERLRQNSILYLAYALVVIPVPISGSGSFLLPLGLPFAAYNFSIAIGANRKLSEELNIFNIQNRILGPKESIVGIIGIEHEGHPPLSVKLE